MLYRSIRRRRISGIAAAVVLAGPGVATAGDPAQGAQAFQYCAGCHSTEPGQNMTGPSLAKVWGREAGSLASFHRYSDALKRSGIVWNEQTLDAWIGNPAALVPGNEMRFPGLADATARSNLIAYLRAVSEGKPPPPSQQGMMMGGGLPDLKQASDNARIKTIRFCDDTYTVTTADGRAVKFWEFNLRFKTDSSSKGPRAGEPVLVGQGMQGDRAQLVFASPDELARFIKSECPK